MKTLFSVGFQSYNPFTLRHPSMGQAHRPSLGEELDANSRMKLLSVINSSKSKLSQVRAWMATQYVKDPTLLSTFKEQFIVDNFRGYDDIVTSDESTVDIAAAKASSPDPANWDFSEDMLVRVQQWAQVVDIMYAAMQEYGGVVAQRGVATTGPMGPTMVRDPRTGLQVPSRIAPGTTVSTAPPSAGISTNTLLIGGGIVAAALAVLLAVKA